MLKSVLAGMTALTILGSGLAVAQQAPQTPPAAGAQRAQPSAEDVAALTDARIAALRAGLKLTAEQEKNWPAVEAALREHAKQRAEQRAERMGARAQAQSGDNARRRPDAIERLRRGADAMTTRAASLKRLADAAEPLYKTLDDGQKRRFGMLMRMGGERGMDRGRGHRRG